MFLIITVVRAFCGRASGVGSTMSGVARHDGGNIAIVLPSGPDNSRSSCLCFYFGGETASKQAQKTTYSCRARQKSQFQIDQHDTSKGPMSPHLNNLRCTTAGHAPQGLDFVLAFGGQGPPPPQVSRPQKNRCRTGVWAQSERSAAQAAVPQNGTPEASHVMPSGKHGRGDASRSRPQDAVASSNRLGLESTISPALGPECLKYRSLGNFCQIWPSPC